MVLNTRSNCLCSCSRKLCQLLEISAGFAESSLRFRALLQCVLSSTAASWLLLRLAHARCVLPTPRCVLCRLTALPHPPDHQPLRGNGLSHHSNQQPPYQGRYTTAGINDLALLADFKARCVLCCRCPLSSAEGGAFQLQPRAAQGGAQGGATPP